MVFSGGKSNSKGLGQLQGVEARGQIRGTDYAGPVGQRELWPCPGSTEEEPWEDLEQGWARL